LFLLLCDHRKRQYGYCTQGSQIFKLFPFKGFHALLTPCLFLGQKYLK
jgi:hypothetical protein